MCVGGGGGEDGGREGGGGERGGGGESQSELTVRVLKQRPSTQKCY